MRDLSLAIACGLTVALATGCGPAERPPATSGTTGSPTPGAPRLTPTGPTAGSTPTGTTSSPAPTPAAGTGECARLPRTTCLVTPTCRLDWLSTGRYRCRAAAGPCETGFAQDDSAACSSHGCRFVPAHCYCPCARDGSADVPDGAEALACDCECGGGPPAKCEPAAAAAAGSGDVES